jgi:hypothetical protein
VNPQHHPRPQNSRRSVLLSLLAIVVLVASVVVADPGRPAAAETSIPSCPGEDSYGVSFSDSITGAKSYTCAEVRGSGTVSVKPNASKTWTATAPYGYYRQDSSRWSSSSSIWWSVAEIATPAPKASVSYSTTANNTVAGTRHFAVNILWTAPAGYVPNMGSKSLLSSSYTIGSTSGAMPFLNPKWTNSQLVEAGDASARIYSDAGYKLVYPTQDTPKDMATYCSYLMAGVYTASLTTTRPDCATVVCASPKPLDAPPSPSWCNINPGPTPYAVGDVDSTGSGVGENTINSVGSDESQFDAHSDNAVASTEAEFIEAGEMLEARSTLAEPLSLRCPAGSVPLFAEVVTFGFEDAPDPELTFFGDGVSIGAIPEFGAVHSGLQLHCRDRNAGLEISGRSVRGSIGDDTVVSDVDEVLAMLGLGDDDMVANGRLAVLLGGLGDDHLVVFGDQAVARGGPGDDLIEAFGVDQLIIGDGGNDTLIGSTGRTFINAQNGRGGDTIICRSPLNEIVFDFGDTLVDCPRYVTPSFTG